LYFTKQLFPIYKKDYSKKCNFNAQKEQIGGIRTLFGYIFEDNDEIKFINTDGVKYDISMLENNFQIDVPVKATLLNETTVKIDKIYGGYAQDICDDVNKVKKSDNDKSEKEILSELKEEIVQIGNYKVMVISGRKSKYYKQYLNLYGLNVTTFNPFEENLNLLNEKVKSQDIIIIMKHTISHDVMKIINLEDKKVQVIGRDNIKYLVARIRYYLANKDEDITKVNY
jgi:hypothetical protein